MMSALALVAAFLYNLGVVLEKRALRGLPPVTAAHPGRLLWTLAGSVGWLAGFGLIGAGLVLQGVVLAHLPFSIAQPLQASGVVVTVVLSRLLLGERPGREELAWLGTVAVAVVLLGLSGGDPAGTSCDGAALLAVGIPACGVAIWLYARSHSAFGLGLSAGLLYGVAGLALKGASTSLAGQPWYLWPSLALASPYAWGVIVCSAMGMILFQSALQRCPASIVVPVSNLTGTAFTIVAGSVLYREHLPSDPRLLALRVGGSVIAIGAALALARVPRQAETTLR